MPTTKTISSNTAGSQWAEAAQHAPANIGIAINEVRWPWSFAKRTSAARVARELVSPARQKAIHMRPLRTKCLRPFAVTVLPCAEQSTCWHANCSRRATRIPVSTRSGKASEEKTGSRSLDHQSHRLGFDIEQPVDQIFVDHGICKQREVHQCCSCGHRYRCSVLKGGWWIPIQVVEEMEGNGWNGGQMD